MSRLLVLGAAPLPFEPMLRQDASSLRTWHFTKPLLDRGHEVSLVAVQSGGAYPDGTPEQVLKEEEKFRYLAVSSRHFHDNDFLQSQHDEFDPDAVIGVNTYPSFRAVTLRTDKPVWCDLNGWCMAEAQTKAQVFQDDIYLSHFWRMERRVLDRADVISTVSRAQAHATVGELASRGRLSFANCGYEHTEAVPNAIVNEEPRREDRGLLRGSKVGKDDFVVLWLGGYNTWTDVDTLMAGLTTAMRANPRVQFVSTGGALKGHDEKTFVRMRKLVDDSEFSDRFTFLGWVPTEDVSSYLFESDLGLNMDNENYETTYGARNRINEMIRHQLPVLTTVGTEISFDLEQRDAAMVVGLRDPAALSAAILKGAEQPSELEGMARRALDFAREHYSYDATTRRLQRFAEKPERAPDNGRRVLFKDVDFFRGRPDSDRLLDEDSEAQERLEELEKYLDGIHSSKFWAMWMLYHRLRRAIGLKVN